MLGIALFVLAIYVGLERRPKKQKTLGAHPKPQFTTELEALIAIEANTRQALELLRQQNRKSFWSMLFLFGMFSDD
jgi:hypothetical protein